MSRYNDWEKLKEQLQRRLQEYKRMACWTGTQLDEVNNIKKLLDGFDAGYRSDDFHTKCKLAVIAAQPQPPVIVTKFKNED